MDNASLAWITSGAALGGGLAGGLVSGFYQHLRDYLARPRLVLDFDPKSRATKTETSDQIFVRIRLRNRGRQTAFGTRVYLTSIEEVHSAETNATPFYEAMPLSWPLNDYEPRDIPPGPDFYVDLVKISKHGPGWVFGVKQLYSSQSEMGDFKGRYRFHLVATSKNGVSPPLAVDVVYEQDWHTLRTLPAPSMNDNW